MIRHLTLSLLAATSISALSGTAALAGNFIALSDGNALQMFNSKARTVTATMPVTGLTAPLAGIDIRPNDGMLYGLQRDGQIVTINLQTGAATAKAKLDQPLPMASVHLTVDFNPVADRMRVVGSDGTNLRINVDDGKTTVDGRLKFADSDTNKSATPQVMAGAYTNKFKGAKETALYEIDGMTGAYVKQAPPNDGVLSTLGMLGRKPMTVAFNIESDGKGANTGWLLTDGQLSMMDLANGATTAVGAVTGLRGMVRDIAVLPAM